MKPIVVLNPYSGRWTALARRAEAENALRAVGVEFDLVLTERPGHAVELAAQAARDGRPLVIAAGGDGLVSEVVNGLLGSAQAGISLPLMGIVPLGTANDLAANLNLPADLPGAARTISAGKSRPIDVGMVTYAVGTALGREMRSRYFDNNSAIGLEPTVTLIQQRITWLRGRLRYLISALIAVMKNPAWEIELEWEGGQYRGPASLVTVANGRMTGGFYMAPHADPYDGKLTFVYGYVPSRITMLGLLPRALKPGVGNYVEHPAIHELHSPWLRIRTKSPTPLHADGEIQSTETDQLEYRVIPCALHVLVI